MQQKAKLTIKLTKSDIPQVKKGESISQGKLLVKSKPKISYRYNLAKILKTQPKKLKTYLQVKPGKKLDLHQVIARKPGWFSRQVFKSPTSGWFEAIDEEKGIYTVSLDSDEREILAWFAGVVDEVTRDQLTFWVKGEPIVGITGRGRSIAGEVYVAAENFEAFAMSEELANRILVMSKIGPIELAKAQALGVVAFVAQELADKNHQTPYLLVNDISALQPHHGKWALLSGDEKALLIINN